MTILSAVVDENLWHASQRQIFEALYTSVQYAYGMQVEGDIIEFGTMTGDTAVVLASAVTSCDRLLAPGYGPVHGAPKTLWLLDSFLGLPEIAAEPDCASPHVLAGIWQPTSCRGISPDELGLRVSAHIGADRTRIIAGWYKDTVPLIPASARFACIHVDCDLYASTMDALNPLFARGQVAEGAVILFDDWKLQPFVAFARRASCLGPTRFALSDSLLRRRPLWHGIPALRGA